MSSKLTRMRFLTCLSFGCILALISCGDSDRIQSIDLNSFTEPVFEGVYLSDNKFFPNDTLVIHPFKLQDTIELRKLMIEFRNDSIFLSNYNFGGWYGKWFADFHEAHCIREDNWLRIHGDLYSRWQLDCSDSIMWKEVDYELVDDVNGTLTFLKRKDTSNCEFRNVMRYLGRGGRNFDNEIRSDIQLR